MNNEKLSLKNIIHKLNLKNIKKDNLIILFLIGVLLLIIIIPTQKNATKENNKISKSDTVSQSEPDNVVTDENQDSYEEQMEKRLEGVLKEVENVGNVKVMITLKSSEERIVEKDIPTTRSSIVESDSDGGSRTTTESSNSEETIYTTGEDGQTTPYIVKEMKPEIEGVLVIATGGDNPDVVRNIYEAIQALFSVDAHKIKIMKMNR